MTAALDRATADRLAKLCGLFSSSHDGERATAAAMADRIVREMGLTWREIFLPALPAPEWHDTPPPTSTWREPQTIAESVQVALAHDDALTLWEVRFVRSIGAQRRPLTQKQIAALDGIIAKVREAAGGAR